MKKNQNHFKQNNHDYWDRYIKNLSYQVKRNLTDTELWEYYIGTLSNPLTLDRFGEVLPDMIQLFIKDVVMDAERLDKTMYFYNNAIWFYLALLRRKTIIKRAKESTKKEPYFNFCPSDNPKINLDEYPDIAGLFEGIPYVLLKEGQPVGKELLENGLKNDKIVEPNTLNRMQNAENRLSELFNGFVNFFKEHSLFTDEQMEKFPVQNELPLFLYRYTPRLYEGLDKKGKKTPQMRAYETERMKNDLIRCLVFHKVYNQKKFLQELNQIILNHNWRKITEGLSSKPVLFEEDGGEHDIYIDFWSWKANKIYDFIEKFDLIPTELTEKEILTTLGAEASLLDDKVSGHIFLFLTKHLELQIEEDLHNVILKEIDSNQSKIFIKEVMNHFGEKLLENPGILLLLSEQVSKLAVDDFNSLFHVKTEEEKADIDNYFELLKKYGSEEQRDKYFTPGELLTKKYLNDDRADIKKKILYSFLFFILWKQLSHYIPHSCEIIEEDLKKYVINNSFNYDRSKKGCVSYAVTVLAERQRMINEMYTFLCSREAVSAEKLCYFANELLKGLEYKSSPKLKIDTAAFEKLDANNLGHMVYNFSADYTNRKYSFYREMTFISDKKKSKLPLRIDNEKWFKNKSAAENYKNTIEKNRLKIKELDVGFKVSRNLGPIPAGDYFWERGINVKLFSDSDKSYEAASIDEKQSKNSKYIKYYITGGGEKYRETNKNHLSDFYMYEAMRNPETHDNGEVLVLSQLKDDRKANKIEILLEALYDCYKYSDDYLEQLKKEGAKGLIWVPTLFFRNKLDEVTAILASKMEELPEDKQTFMSWFDKDGNLLLDSNIFKDISFSDDLQFLQKLENIITKFYNLDYGQELIRYNGYEFDTGINILLYLLYMNVALESL